MDGNNKRFNLYSYFGLVSSIHTLFFLGIWTRMGGSFDLFFFLSLISPIAGLVLSIKGLSDSRKEENKGVVIGAAGTIISAIEIIFIVFYAVAWFWIISNTPQHPYESVVTHSSYDLESQRIEWERAERKMKGYPDSYPDVPLEESFHLKLESDYTISRDENEEFKDITWRVIRNNRCVLERNANGELLLEIDYLWSYGDHGDFTVYLIAFVDGEYRRVSNVIEFTR